MTGTDQATLAAALRDALHGAGLEVAAPYREAGRSYYREASYVAVVGWLLHAGFVLRGRAEAPGAPPAPAPAAPPATHGGPHPPIRRGNMELEP